MYNVTSIHGDEFMTFRPVNGGDARLVHLATRVETMIDPDRFAEYAELTVDYLDDVHGMRETLDDMAATYMVARGLLAWDGWLQEYRSPEDLAADMKADELALVDRLSDLSAYHASVL